MIRIERRALAWRALGAALLLGSAAAAQENAREQERRKLLEKVGLQLKKKAPEAERGAEAAPEKKPGQAGSEEEGDEAPPAPEEGKGSAGAGRAAAVVFAGALHEALVDDCGGCHRPGGLAGAGRFVLDGDDAVDYEVVLRLVTPRAADRSALVRQAQGLGHAGGVVYRPGSPRLAQLAGWVRQGAAPGALGGASAELEPAEPGAGPPPAGAEGSPGPAQQPPVTAGGAAASPGPVRRLPPAVQQALAARCGPCHSPSGMASRSRLSLRGDPALDFESLVPFVRPEQPEQSPLLARGRGEGHAAGAFWSPADADYQATLAWIASAAAGAIAAPAQPAAPPGPGAAAPAGSPRPEAAAGRLPPGQSPPGSTPGQPPPAGPPAPPLPPGHPPLEPAGPAPAGLALPYQLELGGRFDLNYERRDLSGSPFGRGRDVLRSYHRFLFLSRRAADEPIAFSVELIGLSFWEASYRLPLSERLPFRASVAAGKLVVPFGAEPSFHHAYGGLAGFDQRVLPAIWAQEGAALRLLSERGDASLSLDVYAVRGHRLRQAGDVLDLRRDLSPDDEVTLAPGMRLQASYGALSLYYSGYYSALGHGRRLYLQALDLDLWRMRSVPGLGDFTLSLGLLRADVSGAGSGQDYYHFASSLRLRYYPLDWLYLQYRQGVFTRDNRRGNYVDDTRLTSEDASTHNFGAVARWGYVSFGLYHFLLLEKGPEVDDDFTRLTVAYEF